MWAKQSITIITVLITCKVAINQIFTSKARILVLIEWQWSEWGQCIWSDLRHGQSPWSPKMRLVAKRGGCLFSAYDSFPSQPPITPPATRLAVEWSIIMHLGMSFPNFVIWFSFVSKSIRWVKQKARKLTFPLRQSSSPLFLRIDRVYLHQRRISWACGCNAVLAQQLVQTKPGWGQQLRTTRERGRRGENR